MFIFLLVSRLQMRQNIPCATYIFSVAAFSQMMSSITVRLLPRLPGVFHVSKSVITSSRTLSHYPSGFTVPDKFSLKLSSVHTARKHPASSVDESKISKEIKELTENLFQGNRRSLAQAITLLESSHPDRRYEGQYILDRCIRYLNEQEASTGRYTIRIGKNLCD